MIPALRRLGLFDVEPIVWVLFALVLMLFAVLFFAYSRLAKRHNDLLTDVKNMDDELSALEDKVKKLGRGHSSVVSHIRQMRQEAEARPLVRPRVPTTDPTLPQPGERVEAIAGGRHGRPAVPPPVPSRLRRDSA